MPKAFSDQEKEIIARRLLEQGYRLFSAYGLKKTTVEELADAAGISKGAFYGFYESKEALFMDVIEDVEVRTRRDILAVVAQPGPTARMRLFAVLKKAFETFSAVPIFQFLTGSDYDLLFRRVPEGKLQEHLISDQAFFEELIEHCRASGIPIQVEAGQMAGLIYPLVLTLFYQGDGSREPFAGNIEPLLELVAAYSLGEVTLQQQEPLDSALYQNIGKHYESGH